MINGSVLKLGSVSDDVDFFFFKDHCGSDGFCSHIGVGMAVSVSHIYSLLDCHDICLQSC